ncbi:Xaa-Pro aminopeptidase [Streptomyces caniscabiei]|uniref:aminopeptidase P family protein n=1 Tax=Streptomyces caniscabiei TaxID=2746961 RepID=UPI0029B45191|nr:Xaa-Pro aminopeptidase [Streptomyces caniscabiei]MDX2775756.1 Xaa-Pro aminopeptidase [Streptomyces caniscabiei]
MLGSVFFAHNRARLIKQLNGGSFALSAYTKMQRGHDMAGMFEQEANFWWLTGINAPDWWMIVDGARQRTWLVMPEIDETHQIFDGSLSPETAKDISGADEILTNDQGLKLLRNMAKKHSVIHTLGDFPNAEYLDFTLNPAPKKFHDLLVRTFRSVQDCRKDMAQLRALKQPEEIQALKQAIDLTVEAFKQVKTVLPKLKTEYEVEAEFTYYFRRHNALHAYDPIVAAGGNACTLHYGDNAARLRKRELLLMDIGARSGGYPADITRTWAIGEPTKRQKEVHAAVQEAQQKIIALIAPDLAIDVYQREVDEIMIDALMKLGLMKSRSDEKAYHRYFPHAVSHGLGVDVHDSLGRPKRLLVDMVLTVEPGIYIPEEGIGVRIEDDILVTSDGRVNLSGALSTEL